VAKAAANPDAGMRFRVIRRAVQLQIKEEQQVMQQNQRHGTQPNGSSNPLEGFGSKAPQKKIPIVRELFAIDVRASGNEKRPGLPGRSSILEAVRGL
jgi:hypothetical protein